MISKDSPLLYSPVIQFQLKRISVEENSALLPRVDQALRSSEYNILCSNRPKTFKRVRGNALALATMLQCLGYVLGPWRTLLALIRSIFLMAKFTELALRWFAPSVAPVVKIRQMGLVNQVKPHARTLLYIGAGFRYYLWAEILSINYSGVVIMVVSK